MNTKITWVLSALVAFVFAQSTVFKFSGATETVIIFSTIGNWMQSIGLGSTVGRLFGDFGAYAVGSIELLAAILILLPRTRVAGVTLSLAVLSAALFFHLFTPLGVNRVIDAAGNTDGGALFVTAVAMTIASSAVYLLNRQRAHHRKSTKARLHHAM